MKGLRKYLSPFTPDQSGAVSVLFHYGGMLIIMDAGGCVGNICGYDEPRWDKKKSAIFSAALRDLDAILGRDELLIQKTKEALRDIDAKFVGLIGTPVPAVIATDYRALKRLMETDYEVPVVPVETNGIDMYDEGVSRAFLQILKNYLFEEGGSGARFIANGSLKQETLSVDELEDLGKLDKKSASERVGVIGFTPLDTPGSGDYEDMVTALHEQGVDNPIIYGMNDTLEDVAVAAHVARNIVVSPGGVKPARWLRDKYGVQYEICYPLPQDRADEFSCKIMGHEPRKVLIVHQQVLANSLRDVLIGTSEDKSLERVDVASWFMMSKEVRHENDTKLNEEEELMKLVDAEGYDIVIGDPLIKRALPGWKGTFLSLPHFAISASLYSSSSDEEYWQKAGDVVK
nr:nitrogenase component 1 [uncultured Mogibacterium sp.]